jgi:hypothetical protein
MIKGKRGLIILVAISLVLLGMAVLFTSEEFSKKGIHPGNLVPLIIPFILIIIMGIFIARRWKAADQGMPLEDERSRKVKTNAASTAFYISLYWLLAIGWFEEAIAEAFKVERMDAGQAVGAGIGGMAVIFLLCWFYYEKRGKLN